MAPTKRTRPDFDPPRPKASKSAAGKTKATEGSKKRSRPSSDGTAKKTRKVAPSPSLHDSEDDRSDPLSDHDEDASQESPPPSSEAEQAKSPEPDHMLVEITNEPDADASISLPLLRRTMQEHFKDEAKTKISTDALKILGVYIDTFTREAIARCALERKEKDDQAAGDSWLEVIDLEKIAPQLVLDF